MAKTTDPPAVYETDGETQAIDQLQALGAALAAGIKDADEQQRTLAKIIEQVTALSPETRKMLLQQPAIREIVNVALEADQPVPKGTPPGTIQIHPQFGKYNKVPWTEGDLRRKVEDGSMPLITFIPIERIPIWWNGLRRQLHRGRETTIEKCFYDIYVDHLKALQVAEEHAAWMFDTPDMIGRKHYPAPSDPTVVTQDSARVRGSGDGTRNVSEGFGDLINATTAGRDGDAA